MDQETREEFGKTHHAMGELRRELRRSLDEMRQEVRALTRLTGVIGSSLGSLHGAVGDLAKQLMETNKRLDLFVPLSIEARTEEVERYRTLQERIDDVQRQVAELQAKESR